ncbi:MAG: class I SAM-dependent methyltransferase [Kineosporiaceae bacterium]
MLDTDSGPARAAYLTVVRGTRRALDGTSLLRAWDRRAAERPGSTVAHLRTLLAVHNAEDLVAMDLPWWTYEAIEVVEKFLADRGGRARVFEYGSGASTVWLARRSASVDAVEHHDGWAGRVRELLAAAPGVTADVSLHVPEVPATDRPAVPSASPGASGLDFSEYVATVDTVGGEPFDLVLVDGRAREESLRRAAHRVRDDGLLLLDDAQRPRYREVLAEMAATGWTVTVTRGRTPCQPLPRETALLRRATGSGPVLT